MTDFLEMLADNEQVAFGHEVVHVGNPAGQRVVDGNHRVGGFALADGVKSVLERGAGKGFRVRIHGAASEVGKSPLHALEGYFFGVFGHGTLKFKISVE